MKHRSEASGLPRVALSVEQWAMIVLAVLIVLALTAVAMMVWW